MATASPLPSLRERLRGRTIYLLIITVVLNIGYPLSEINDVWQIIYAALWCGLYGFGVYTVARARWHTAVALVGTPILIIATLLRVVYPDNLPIALLVYGGFVVFNLTIMVALLDFIFIQSERVTRDVLVAAVTVYLLIGDCFMPIYIILEVLTQASMGQAAFLVNTASPVSWQLLTYFSYVTLTTAGYGDIIPLTSLARSLVSAEAVIGVLYIAILIGRLVGLYSQKT
ncbi:MAG: hypothetical protein GC204_17420 [Chloroflexi bacterium]|nr:hypothetical protein [Chloroflexota bacterium]